jgi:hypothetical protein
MRAWQLDKIRRALRSYCAHKSADGKTYSVRQILDDIPAGYGPDLELEAFRRFYVGESKSFKDPQSIDDIVVFLNEVGLLTPADLEEDEATFSEAVTIHNAIANMSKDAADEHSRLAGEYTALLEKGGGVTLSLCLVIEPPGTLLWIEEEYIRRADAVSSFKDDGMLRVFRKGYGMSVGTVPTLNFFARGADRMDLVHYICVPHAEDRAGVLSFMRCGVQDEIGRRGDAAIVTFQSTNRKAASMEPRLRPVPAVELDFASLTARSSR